jgi:hypothetical protein
LTWSSLPYIYIYICENEDCSLFDNFACFVFSKQVFYGLPCGVVLFGLLVGVVGLYWCDVSGVAVGGVLWMGSLFGLPVSMLVRVKV